MKPARAWVVAAWLALGSGLGGAAAGAENPAARVIVVANSADPDSVRLARYYAEKRAVPPENIISLKMPTAETIAWPEFVASIWQPLQDELVRLQWIDAVTSNLLDEAGRRKIAPAGHRISYLVVCRGVPLRIGNSTDLQHSPPTDPMNPNHTNEAAVDSELALLARPLASVNGFVVNPLYHIEHPNRFESASVVRVSRLDGPRFEYARLLVDNALEAERNGLLGRAYVDIGGIVPEGDRRLESVSSQVSALGFDIDVDRSPSTFPAVARMDAPVLYFGWYTEDMTGPFLLPGFQFPPGAIALHIHSFSARTLRSDVMGWSGPLVARGVTATVGNVFEPYLQLTHEPDMLFSALARGDTLGEAAYYALPGLSWQAIVIGDPLYRPFAVPVDDQVKNAALLPARLAGYAAIRQAHLMDAGGHSAEALEVLRREFSERPRMPVGLEIASRLEADGNPKGAAAALASVPLKDDFAADELALAHLVAVHLVSEGAPEKAVLVYRQLFRSASLTRELRSPWLRDAAKAAVAAKDAAQAALWEKQSGE